MVEATNIEEYVPISTPKIIAKEKPLKISPPKINIENNQSLVNNGRKKYGCGDLLFTMDIYALKYPKDEC